MATNNAVHDPLEFIKNMWGRMGFTLPGMVTPTLDVGELDKRICDMRAVEGWLKMNLSMLQMAIQGLDMQRATIATLHAMSQPLQKAAASTAGEAEATAAANNPFLWPWNMMNKTDDAAVPATTATASEKPRAKRKDPAPSSGK
ncbi:MAG: hypothetical protein LBG78_09595 [Azoarcus sp.]|jgi:hypothetical protein|nr:hypothetical protein [Azoarcus sp.]